MSWPGWLPYVVAADANGGLASTGMAGAAGFAGEHPASLAAAALRRHDVRACPASVAG